MLSPRPSGGNRCQAKGNAAPSAAWPQPQRCCCCCCCFPLPLRRREAALTAMFPSRLPPSSSPRVITQIFLLTHIYLQQYAMGHLVQTECLGYSSNYTPQGTIHQDGKPLLCKKWEFDLMDSACSGFQNHGQQLMNKTTAMLQQLQQFVLSMMSKCLLGVLIRYKWPWWKEKNGNMKLTAILASAVLIEAHVSSLRSKMMINFTPGCLVLQEKWGSCI